MFLIRIVLPPPLNNLKRANGATHQITNNALSHKLVTFLT